MFTRPQLAARAHVLRNALDLLADQSDRDGKGRFFSVGPMKVELGRLEADIRQIDNPDSLGVRLEAELRQINNPDSPIAILDRELWKTGGAA